MINSTPTSADALIAALHEPGREHLLDLVRNPLRLTLLCMTWDGSSLPDTQAELYERYLRKIYKWNQNWHELEDHAERCGTTTTKLKQNLNQQLGELAKAALNLPQERFRLSQALVEKYLGEESDRTSLAYLALRLGWLNRVGKDGRGDAIFAFYHATFQEYFAALAVEDWDYFLPRNHVDCPVEGKQYRIFEKQWKQVILLWLGREDIGDEEKEGFIRGLVEFQDGVRDYFYADQAYFLAAAAINEFKDCSLADEIVRQVGKWGFGYFDIEKQEWRIFLEPIKKGARNAIPETIRPLAISALIDILDHCPDEWTRCQVAESLGEIDPGNSEAIAALVELIRTSENQHIQGHAVERLEKIGKDNPEAIARLVEVIRTTENESTRRLAADSLAKIDPGNPEAIARLLELIRTTEDEDVRLSAAMSLDKVDPGNPDVIAGLLELLHTHNNRDTRCLAAMSLEKVDPGNPDFIAGLLELICTTEEDEDIRLRATWSLWRVAPENAKEVIALSLEILRTTQDQETRRRAAWTLGQIGVGNTEVIAGLLEFICTTKDEDIYRSVARDLGKISVGNPEAIALLLEILRTTQDQETRRRAAWTLGQIGVGNTEAIAGLLKILRTTEDESVLLLVAKSLGEIDPGNPEAIAGLLELIRTTEDESVLLLAAESLGKIDPGNPEAIAGLLKVICTTEDQRPTVFNSPERRRMDAFGCLSRMGQENPEIIAALLEILRTTEDEDILWQAAVSLGEIGVGNPEAIAGLLKILRTTEDEDTRMWAAESLKQIDPGNPEEIAGLVKVIRTTENESTRMWAAWSLEEIDPGNPEAIAGLVKATETTDDEDTRNGAAIRLQTILTTRQHYAGVVSALKHNLSDEVYQNNFKRFKASYDLIWNCVENLPYPEFYQAWHNPPTTPHPEVEDNTPVASTPFTQQCNLALLPQILNQAIQTHPLNCQPICIDGSRFSDPSNPALQIYTTLKKAGCPASPDGKPRTIAELQAYCEDDLSAEKIALILYEEPTDPPPQGFDIAVLNQLARFSHPPIAVVVPQPLPECRLPQFRESDPDLIATLLQWLHNLERMNP